MYLYQCFWVLLVTGVVERGYCINISNFKQLVKERAFVQVSDGHSFSAYLEHLQSAQKNNLQTDTTIFMRYHGKYIQYIYDKKGSLGLNSMCCLLWLWFDSRFSHCQEVKAHDNMI